ncbi:hypothetical protein KAR91_83300 [Candidatus Pacearchaeota archaeon]|nr:hypothetical protein [Candidatus Pacearchaeota archaeon]
MYNNDIVHLCYEKAVQLLKENSQPEGFVASSATRHYAALWARDACITSIGANLTRVSELIEASKNTLSTLSKLQAPMGQVPAVYWPKQSYWDWSEAGATDASTWFVIAAWHYYKTTGDKRSLEELYPHVQKAFVWLRCQDAANFGLVESPEASDWMDSTLNRGGKVMYINALYYWATLAINELGRELGNNSQYADVEAIKFKFNVLFWPSMDSDYSELLRHVGYPTGAQVSFPHPCSISAFHEAAKGRRFYLSHVAYGRFVDVCDILGNSLAILTGIADHDRETSILRYFREKEVSSPYPAKCLAEPITKGHDNWGMLKSNVERFQSEQWRNPPSCYHNGGVWPFIGGFYVLALLKCGQKELAKAELVQLAKANKVGVQGEWEFREWINAKTATPAGAPYQSWNAATYVMAYKAVVDGLPISLMT